MHAKTRLSTLVFSVAVIGLTTPQLPAQIVAWNVNGINSSTTNPFSATTLATGLSSATLTIGSGVTASSASSTFGGSDFNTTSLASAITGNDYLSFSITPSAGYSFSASSLSLTFGVATAVTNFNVALMSSATGFTSGSELWTFSFSTASPATQSITLSGLSGLQGLSSATEFRLYGYRDGSGTTTFRIRDLSGNDLSLSGSVSAIPEPSTYAAIFGAAALAAAIWSRRRPRDAAPNRPPRP